MKDKFIKDEIWSLVFSAAFQRASVYRPDVKDDRDDDKQDFKTKTRAFVENNLLPKYTLGHVSDAAHIQAIKDLSEFTRQFAGILNGGKLNFGVSQKILNLYLKYKWCLNEIEEPPHFPVDRRIQEILKISQIEAWTKYKDEVLYMQVINTARKNIGAYKSIAEKELDEFARRIKTS